MLLGIRWYQFVRNGDGRRLTKQPKLTAIIQSRRLTLLGHIMRMDDNADAKRILLVPLQRTGEDNQVVPASCGLALSNRIWNSTTLRSPKQQIWLRTTLCGGWCQRMVLRNHRAACQNWRRRRPLFGYSMTQVQLINLNGSHVKQHAVLLIHVKLSSY